MKKPIKFGKYLLLERINIGGMAEVFKAKSFGVEGFEKMLAIKRILPNIAEDEEFITMFIDEAKIAVQLNHANIAQIYDLGKIEESYFIALEFIAGKDLRTIWDRHKKRGLLLPIPMSVYIISRACEGLDYAHRKKDAAGRDLNIVHRDVSPQNVLISYEGEVKVIDFGIAKAANKASKTQAGILKGKFGYMSPEQVRGLPLDRRSDIFSTGIILYELLTGERLFVGESDFSTLEKVRNVEILPPSTYNRKIPDTLEKIVLKALSKDPDDRFQTSYDMQEELQRFLILNKTNFARKDLANYMKRAFKADIERARKRQAAYASASPDDAEEATGPGINTEPGLGGPPQVTRPTPPPTAAPPAPFRQPPPVAAPPMPAAAPAGQFDVFAGDDDDEDDDVETVIFDPRSQETGDASTSPAGPPSMPLPPPAMVAPPPRPRPTGSGPKARPAARPSPLADVFDDEVEETITAPSGLNRPLPAGGPTDAFDSEPAFATDESTAAHDMPLTQPKSKLNLIIIGLAVVAVIVVGLAVFKFLQQKGILGGGVVLTVKVTPPDAQIYLDNKLAGDFSPNVIKDVAPGPHLLLAKRENYQDHQEKIEVNSGEPKTVPIEMSYIPASLEVQVEPADATVKMNGDVIGKSSPVKKDDVLTGVEQEFTFERQGYTTQTRKWSFKPKEIRKESITLAEIAFDVDVQSEPAGASVLLDDEQKGKTPLVIEGLKASRQYKLKIKHRRYPEWESTIRHIEGELVQRVRVNLDATKPKTADKEEAPKPGSDVAEVQPAPKPTPKPRPKPKPKPKPKPRPVAGKGKLMLNSTPWGKVIIDGKDINRSTPLLNYEIAAGKHKITINFATGESKTVSVVVKANETVKKIVRLP